MQNLFFFTTILVVFLLIANLDNVQAGKKKKKNKSKTKKTPEEVLKQDQSLFDSKTLKCLVCKNVIDEFEAAIYKVDPKKMVDTGTFRINEKGEQKRQVVSTPYSFFTNLYAYILAILHVFFEFFLGMYLQILNN